MMGFFAFLFSILADLVNFNRRLVETTLQKVRRMEMERAEADRERLGTQTDPGGSIEASLEKTDVARRAGRGGA